MKSICSSKRGMSLVLEAFIGFVLAVFAIVIILYVAARLTGLLFSSDIDPATESNMNTLAKTIDALSKSKDKDVMRHFPFHVGDNYFLVGFSRSQPVVEDCRPISIAQVTAQPPPQCGDKACLCLYKNSFGFDDLAKSPLKCIQLQGVDVIYSPYYRDEQRMLLASRLPTEVADNLRAAPMSSKPKSFGGWAGQYQYFILYGKCMGPYSFGVQELYIDVHREEGKTYVFIAGESGNTQDRYNDLQQALAGFPSTLDATLDSLIAKIKQNKDPFEVRNAIFTVLSSPELVNRFLATHSLEEFKELFFKRYVPSTAPIPSPTEGTIRSSAERIWAQYFNVLVRLGYPGEPSYVSACVTAWRYANVNNECWLPKHENL